MKNVKRSKLTSQEQAVITAFSRRVKKALGKQLKSIKLFGSKVRGDFHKESDVDIYIIVKNRTNRVLDTISQIEVDVWEEFEVFLSPVVYSEYEEKKNLDMHSFFFEAVEKEGVPI